MEYNRLSVKAQLGPGLTEAEQRRADELREESALERDTIGGVSGHQTLSYSSWRRSQSCHASPSSRPFGARSRIP